MGTLSSGKDTTGTAGEQFRNLAVPIRHIAALAERYRLIITHGNGPQVGNLLLQEESCNAVPKLPLELLVAQTQGQMGYMIESALDGALMALGHSADRHFVSLISYVVVDPDDPAFSAPSKPVGPAFSREQAMALPYPTQKTASGYRRIVASPEPVTIVEKREIRDLISRDYIVTCCGGGGIPVVRHGRSFTGVHAVIDKDLAIAKLAEEIGVDVFLIATNVEGAMLNFATPKQKLLSNVSASEARQYIAGGHFSAGSMAPKVEAAIRFIQQGGQRAIICSIEEIEAAIAGDAGTQFFPRASSLPTAENIEPFSRTAQTGIGDFPALALNFRSGRCFRRKCIGSSSDSPLLLPIQTRSLDSSRNRDHTFTTAIPFASLSMGLNAAFRSSTVVRCTLDERGRHC